jgi:hypothetical protein
MQGLLNLIRWMLLEAEWQLSAADVVKRTFR